MAWSTRQAVKKALELGRRAGCTKESATAVAERGPDMNDLAATERGTAPLRFNPTIGLAGFGVLLGWHFLILYFSFPMAGELIPAEYAFLRQVALNASLCVFFGLFGRLMKNLPQRDGIKSHTISYSATAIGVLGNVLLLASPTLGIVWSMVAVTIIGASESVLMLFWLRFYTETAENYTGKCLGASAVLASLICFFTYHLTVEVSMVVLAALPLASGALLVCMTKDVPLRKNDPSGLGSGIPDWGPVRKPYWKATAQLMAMSLFFGVVQGCSSPEKTLLPAADPVTILGAGFAGVVLFVIYARSEHLPEVGAVVSTSLMMYVAGMMLLPFHAPYLSQAAAFLIMTGFIFYFVLTLVFIVDLCRTFDLNATMVAGMNQALEYAMFAIGIVAGKLLWVRFADEHSLPFGISLVAVLALYAITLFLTTDRPPWKAAYYKPACPSDPTADKRHEEAAEVDVVAVLCERYTLTPREIEVFSLLAKGRNAEFIQNALVISNHTVKTHIYNIYRKMDVHSLQDLLDVLDAEEDAQAKNQPTGTTAEGVNGV